MVIPILAIAIVAQFYLVPAVISDPSEPRQNVSKTVVGGSAAKVGQFPYQVFIICGKFICGGSIYDKNTVITAAHCVFDEDNNRMLNETDFEIYAGSTEQSRGQRRLARYVTMHENYNPNTLLNDMAIIGLKQPLNFSKTVDKIPSYTSGRPLKPGTKCVVSGFGKTSSHESSGNLRYATIDIKKDADCAKNHGQWNSASMVCAAGVGKDSCQGDSGGPLACQIQGKRYLYGVVSFGPEGVDCGTDGYPSTYSKVSYFNSWVRQNIH